MHQPSSDPRHDGAPEDAGRRRVLASAAALAASTFAPRVLAQSYPARPVKLIVGFAAGGTTDLVARAVAQGLSQRLGQPVIVENKPGASGNIAADTVWQAPSDGHTLLFASAAFAIAPLFGKTKWDPLKDFTPVALAGTVPIVALVGSSMPVQTPQALVAYSRAHPKSMSLASGGAATVPRLAAEMFKHVAGLDWVTMHYKGGAPALQDLLGGHAHVMFTSIPEAQSLIQSGRLRAVGVTTPKRAALLPAVPTIAESGYPGFSFAVWQAIIGPPMLPKAIVERLSRETMAVMNSREMRDKLLPLGAEPTTSTPEQLRVFMGNEVAKVQKIAQVLGDQLHE